MHEVSRLTKFKQLASCGDTKILRRHTLLWTRDSGSAYFSREQVIAMNHTGVGQTDSSLGHVERI